MSEIRDDLLESEGTPEPKGPAWHRAHVIMMGLAGLGILVWLATGFYKVGVGEVALVERLGGYLQTPEGHALQVEPGWHFGMPWPIDRVQIVAVQKFQTVEATTFIPQPGKNAEVRQAMSQKGDSLDIIAAVMDPYLITADKNVVHMSLSMQYRISDPEKYLGVVAESKGHWVGTREELLQQLVEHEMIAVISRLNVDDVLAMQSGQQGKPAVGEEQRELRAPGDLNIAIRALFDSELGKRFGISVQQVLVTDTRPPDGGGVREAFLEVTRARGAKKAATDLAESQRAAMIAVAKADHDAMVNEARAYRQQMMDRATGEAQQFKQVYAQYVKDREVTKYDLYQSALAEVTKSAKRIYFVEEGQLVYITIAPPEGVITTEGGGMPPGRPGGPPR